MTAEELERAEMLVDRIESLIDSALTQVRNLSFDLADTARKMESAAGTMSSAASRMESAAGTFSMASRR